MTERHDLPDNLLTIPPHRAFAVTPNDSADLPHLTRGFYVGTGGDVRVTTHGGDVVTYVNMPSGGYKVGAFRRIWATGTTAADLVGEY
jgi:hypothetical protein